METIEKTEDGRLLLRVDKSLYHKEAILSASYRFTNDFFVNVSSIEDQHYVIQFTPKLPNADNITRVNEFCNELIDQELRLSLKESSQPIRELIVRKAFFPFDNE